VNPGRLLAISVVLNLGLAGAIAFRVLGTAPLPSSPVTSARPVVRKVVETRDVVQPGAVVQQDWRAVENEDYRKYIANLRAIGCPEETIRDIIILDIHKQYTERWKKANPLKTFKFWESTYDGFGVESKSGEERARERALADFTREKRDLVRSLLGVDLVEELAKYHMSNSRADLENMWTFLTPEKRDVIKKIQSRYAELTQAIRSQADPDGYLPPELQKQIKELRARNEAELAQTMSPAELEEYNLRMSPTATRVRADLSAFDPSEDEYKRIFALRKEYEDKLADLALDPTDPQLAKERTEAARLMDEKIKAVLTPNRFEEYKLARDAEYRDAFRFVTLWELPKDAAGAIYGMRRAVDAQVRKLRADNSVDKPTKQTMMTAIQAETQRSLKNALGEKAYQSYMRTRGSWARDLARTVP
jgi:hypothetical protein